jgi:5-methylthioadenosine/S-adenosylhomocysteine deaminase
MIEVGTSCFAEAGGPFPVVMGRAALAVGIRGFICQSTLDQAGSIGTDTPANMVMTTQQAYDSNIGLRQRWSGQGQDRVQAWYALRQIIVCSPELIAGVAKAAVENGTRIHTHLCEGVYEIDFAAAEFGKRPTEYLADLGVLGDHLHCAHSILLSPEEVDLYAANRVSACHCALNNYSTGHPRLAEMWRRGIAIGLGTDGVTANGSLDMFQVAHAARIGQQAVAGTPFAVRVAISGEELLKVATRGGARALGQGDAIGCLAEGFRADLLLCDLSEFDHFPANDPMMTAAHTIVGRDVTDVIVDGAVVMRNREILTVDTEALRFDLRRRLPDLYERFERMVA